MDKFGNSFRNERRDLTSMKEKTFSFCFRRLSIRHLRVGAVQVMIDKSVRLADTEDRFSMMQFHCFAERDSCQVILIRAPHRDFTVRLHHRVNFYFYFSSFFAFLNTRFFLSFSYMLVGSVCASRSTSSSKKRFA